MFLISVFPSLFPGWYSDYITMLAHTPVKSHPPQFYSPIQSKWQTRIKKTRKSRIRK